MQTRNIYEFIVLRQKDNVSNLPSLMADYDREAQSVAGFISSGHFQSFYALPEMDTAPVYVMIYQWSNQVIIPIARDYLMTTKALQALFDAAQVTGFALTEQIEGQVVDMQSLVTQPTQVLELAIRRIKTGQEQTFEARRKAFVAKLDGNPGVVASAEFVAVMGYNYNHLTVGVTVYRNQAVFQQLAGEIMNEPTTSDYFATFEPEALKYLTTL